MRKVKELIIEEKRKETEGDNVSTDLFGAISIIIACFVLWIFMKPSVNWLLVVFALLVFFVVFVTRLVKSYKKWRKWRKIEKNLEDMLQDPEIKEAVENYEKVSDKFSFFEEITNGEIEKFGNIIRSMEEAIKDEKSKKETAQKALIEKIEKTKF